MALSTELRLRAAEMCEWLSSLAGSDGHRNRHPSTEVDDGAALEEQPAGQSGEVNVGPIMEGAFADLWAELILDPEPTVRDTAESAFRNRRKRLWAQAYTRSVLDAEVGTNDEVLRAWPYSEALVEIGDDTVVETLRRLAGNLAAPPNVRYWATRTAKAVEESWRKVVQKWPKAGRSWGGEFERGKGYLLVGNRKVPIQYMLWYDAVDEGSGTGQQGWGDWGGAVFTSERLVASGESTWLAIETEDGRAGLVTITYEDATDGYVTFNGLGSHPV